MAPLEWGAIVNFHKQSCVSLFRTPKTVTENDRCLRFWVMQKQNSLRLKQQWLVSDWEWPFLGAQIYNRFIALLNLHLSFWDEMDWFAKFEIVYCSYFIQYQINIVFLSKANRKKKQILLKSSKNWVIFTNPNLAFLFVHNKKRWRRQLVVAIRCHHNRWSQAIHCKLASVYQNWANFF